MKPIVGGLMFLGAVLVASTVASRVATDVLFYADTLGWQAFVLLAWPALLFAWSRY